MCLCALGTVSSLRAVHLSGCCSAHFSPFLFCLSSVLIDCMIVKGVVVMMCSVCSSFFFFVCFYLGVYFAFFCERILPHLLNGDYAL